MVWNMITRATVVNSNLSSASVQWVTRDQYQHFIDVMQARGSFVQPDHWQSSHYPAGTEHLPIVGIRASDAVQYCAWLSAQSGRKWHYRLPHMNEISLGQNAPVGYWCVEDKNAYKLVDVTRSRSSQLQADKLSFYLAKDLDLALMLARAGERDLALSLSREVDLALHRARVRPIALELHLQHIHKRIRSNRLFRTMGRVRFRTIPHDFMRALDLDRDLAAALEQVSSRSETGQMMREHTRSVLVIILDLLYRVRPIEKVHVASHAEREQISRLINEYLDLYIDLVTLEERVEGRLEAFEGLQIIREPRPNTVTRITKFWHQRFKRATV